VYAPAPLTTDEIWYDDELMSINANAGCDMITLTRIVRAVERISASKRAVASVQNRPKPPGAAFSPRLVENLSDSSIDALDTSGLHVTAPGQKQSVRDFARAVERVILYRLGVQPGTVLNGLMSDSQLDELIIKTSELLDSVAEACHYIEYDPYKGKVDGHFVPKYHIRKIARSIEASVLSRVMLEMAAASDLGKT
jgi:hypothetical protein